MSALIRCLLLISGVCWWVSAAYATSNLPAGLTVSTVSPVGEYTVSWSSSFDAKRYVLLETRSDGSSHVVQRGGSAYTGMLATDDYAVYQLAELSPVYSPNQLPIWVYSRRSGQSLAIAGDNPVTRVGNTFIWSAIQDTDSYVLEQRSTAFSGSTWSIQSSGLALSWTPPVTLSSDYEYRLTVCIEGVCTEIFVGPAIEAADVGYQYDALGRLVDVDWSTGESRDYQYDDAGNRTSVQSTGGGQ